MSAFKEALKIDCPLCKAKAGEACVYVGEARKWKRGQKCSTLHNERLRAHRVNVALLNNEVQ